jgi:NhaC family Na+:H+ antiporter
MAGSQLFEHIKHMLYTTIPSFALSLVLYGIIGMKYAGGEISNGSINQLLEALSNNFNINIMLFIPPIFVIVMVILKFPAIPVLISGSILGGVFAVIFQGASLGNVINAAHYGYVSNTGIEVIDQLLSNGGLDNMMWTLSLMLCVMILGGVLETSGILEVIANSIL